ncbi:MAG: hypothetical protein DRQ10_00305 [Candidatus Hydrothermota bacterium]|nr:MAG: hypothetical protein DRQ10_00305 [Candidatus Hydrothermae bacterium]
MSDKEIIEFAKKTIRAEIEGLHRLEKDAIDQNFVRAVRLILDKTRFGRVIVTGIGKSGIVGKKIAATLTSLGTPAIFLHPTESLHGDLGIVGKNDVVIVISKSGESDEFVMLIPLLKKWGMPIIAITANKNSSLAQNADIVIHVPIEHEACPYDVAPTTSTTAMMALGDALAIVLAYEKGLKLQDFAKLHPGGAIGKKFWLKVEDMMLTGEKHVPVVHEDASMKQVILEMTSKRGITSVVDSEGRVVGVFTDGDLRRLLERETDIFKFKAKDIMNPNPKTITKDELAITAANKMEHYGITALIVIDEERHPIGIIHLHDLMRERVV